MENGEELLPVLNEKVDPDDGDPNWKGFLSNPMVLPSGTLVITWPSVTTPFSPSECSSLAGDISDGAGAVDNTCVAGVVHTAGNATVAGVDTRVDHASTAKDPPGEALLVVHRFSVVADGKEKLRSQLQEKRRLLSGWIDATAADDETLWL